MANPIFRNFQDKYVADVFSEALVPGDYKHFYSLEGTDFTRTDGFPPEPSFLTSVTATFIARDDTITRLAVHGLSGSEYEPKERALIDAYAQTVGVPRAAVPILEANAEQLGIERANARFGRLGQWCIEATQNDNKRLIAAHLVFVSARDHRLHDALTYPTALKEEFPLIVRDYFSSLVLIKDEARGSLIDELPQNLRETLSAIILNQDEVSSVAAIAVSSVMPSVAKFREALRAVKTKRH
ncbi:MAG: hypothetical protein ABI602_01230 [Candidatus Saccharibacteria bacterium]